MKKSIRFLIACLVVFVSVFTLTGCGSANIYRAFDNEGASLPKSHILKSVSASKLIDMVTTQTETDGKIYVFFGTPTDSTSRTNVVVYNEQAQQYNVEVIYYLNSDLSSKKLEQVKNTLGIASTNVTGALWAFENTQNVFDSSSTKYNTDDNGNELSNIEIAQRCFDSDKPYDIN